MTEEMKRSDEELSAEDLQAERGPEPPDREATSLIHPNIAAPVDAAVAANILSDDSSAQANAEQNVDIDHST